MATRKIYVVVDRDHKPGEPEVRAFATHSLAYKFLVSRPINHRTMLYGVDLEEG